MGKWNSICLSSKNETNLKTQREPSLYPLIFFHEFSTYGMALIC